MTKYDPAYPQQMYDLMKNGAKDCQLYVAFDVCKDTFIEWKKQHPEFKEAHDRGLEACEKWWEDQGIEFMQKGNKSAFNYWIAFMNRKFGWKTGSQADSATTNQVNIGSISIHNDKSKQELIEFLTSTDVVDIQPSIDAIDVQPQELLEYNDTKEKSGEQE